MQKRSLLLLWGGKLGTMAALSLVMSLMALSQPLYMLNLYDRVLSSQSVDSLISITAITVFVLLCYGGFDWARHLVQDQMGRSIEDAIRPTLMEVSIRQAAFGKNVQQRLSRLDELKNFVTGNAFSSLFDLIFVPIYFTALFLFHPLIGTVCAIFSLVTIALALIPEWSLKAPMADYFLHKFRLRKDEAELISNASDLLVLGGVGQVLGRYLKHEELVESKMSQSQAQLSRIQTMNKVVMMIIQTLVLGLACYLVIRRDIGTGVMFAVNIVATRAMQPLFQVTSSFKSLSKAMTAWSDISESLMRYKKDERAIQDITSANVRVRSLTILNRDEDRKILNNIQMDVDPGEMVVAAGASGAGKSTLLRAVAGLIPDYIGTLELDNRELKHWRFERDSAFIGYLPQEIRLFHGTIIENITLFAVEPDLESVSNLCMELGLQEDISALKDGYQTMVEPDALQFSGGQIKLLAVARALYGNAQLLVLDEPTSGLDFEHEVMVLNTLQKRQAAGVAVLLSTHSAYILRAATKIIWLKWGQVKGYGLRDDVLMKMGMKEAA
ncbi:MAG: ATP-binding cassette domain-containing protein [Sterolibacterium sp.]